MVDTTMLISDQLSQISGMQSVNLGWFRQCIYILAFILFPFRLISMVLLTEMLVKEMSVLRKSFFPFHTILILLKFF